LAEKVVIIIFQSQLWSVVSSVLIRIAFTQFPGSSSVMTSTFDLKT